jgi:hypothetical protein
VTGEACAAQVLPTGNGVYVCLGEVLPNGDLGVIAFADFTPANARAFAREVLKVADEEEYRVHL